MSSHFGRARWGDSHGEVEQRRHEPARHAHPRLPKLLHDEHCAVGLDRELPVLNEQGKHIGYIVAQALSKGIDTLEVSEAAESEWVETILRLAAGRSGFSESCTPGYYNNEGQPTPASRQGSFFFGGPTEFVDTLEAWREDGEMRGLERRQS